MTKRIGVVATTCAAMVLGLACGAVAAQDLGKLGGKLGGLLPGGGSMSSGSMGNVAGLLQYCVKNNYLGGASGASGIKDKLMGKLGGGSSGHEASSDPGFLSGAKGILQGGHGKTLDLAHAGGGSSDLKSKITTKVCDTVLHQGKSFLGM